MVDFQNNTIMIGVNCLEKYKFTVFLFRVRLIWWYFPSKICTSKYQCNTYMHELFQISWNLKYKKNWTLHLMCLLFTCYWCAFSRTRKSVLIEHAAPCKDLCISSCLARWRDGVGLSANTRRAKSSISATQRARVSCHPWETSFSLLPLLSFSLHDGKMWNLPRRNTHHTTVILPREPYRTSDISRPFSGIPNHPRFNHHIQDYCQVSFNQNGD
jgi:hypothetical protein